MGDYTQATDFSDKDALPSGNAEKAVSGSDIDGEFSLIATAISEKIDKPAAPATAEVLYYDGDWTAKDLGADGTAGQVFRTDGTNADWGTAHTGSSYGTVGTGTTATISSIPSWVTRVEVSLVGVSLSGSSNIKFQPGDSGGAQTSGYTGCSSNAGGGSQDDWLTAQAAIVGYSGGGTQSITGQIIMTLADSSTNVWAISVNTGRDGSDGTTNGGGSVTLDSALTQVTIGSVNGSDVFDAGSWSIRYS